MADEKKDIHQAPALSIRAGEMEDAPSSGKGEDSFEVFKDTADGVQFRLVGWLKASVIFLKSKEKMRILINVFLTR